MLGKVRQLRTCQLKGACFQLAPLAVHEAGGDLPLVHVESNKTCRRISRHAIIPWARSAGDTRSSAWVAKPDLRDRSGFAHVGAKLAITSSSSRLNRVGRGVLSYGGGLKAPTFYRAAP